MKKSNLFITTIAILIITVVLIFANMKTNRIAVFETNQGVFKVELYEDKTPITAGNFIKLAESGFYDGTRFHRVIDGFMIQGGDPKSKNLSLRDEWGTGSPGYKIKDEIIGLSNAVGTISMANSGPNTGGSQFFINVAPNTFLDQKHPVFGKVVEGYEVVQKISKLKTSSDDQPFDDVIINSIKIQ